MSVLKKLLVGAGGAAVLATGLASGAQAHTVVGAASGSCEMYAQQYAAAYGGAGWDQAYRFAYNQCVAGGPSFVATPTAAAPYGYNQGYNYGLGGLLAAPFNLAGTAIHAGANVAGAAINTGAALAGTALSIPGAVLGGTAPGYAPTPYAQTPAPSTAALAAPRTADVEPIERKNYRGTFEEPQVTAVATQSSAALQAPAQAAAPAPHTPEWYQYCAAKYNSFNPETGMYLAYSGQYRMCQ